MKYLAIAAFIAQGQTASLNQLALAQTQELETDSASESKRISFTGYDDLELDLGDSFGIGSGEIQQVEIDGVAST